MVVHHAKAASNHFKAEVKRLWKKHWKLVCALLIILFMFLFMKKFLILLAFIGVNTGVAFLWLTFGNRSIGFELVLFTSIVTLFAFGLKASLFLIIVSLLLHNYITMNISMNALLNIPVGMICLGIGALFKPMGIITVGIGLTILFNLIFTLIVFFLKTGSTARRLIYFATNLLFNWVLFTFLGAALVKVIA